MTSFIHFINLVLVSLLFNLVDAIPTCPITSIVVTPTSIYPGQTITIVALSPIGCTLNFALGGLNIGSIVSSATGVATKTYTGATTPGTYTIIANSVDASLSTTITVLPCTISLTPFVSTVLTNLPTIAGITNTAGNCGSGTVSLKIDEGTGIAQTKSGSVVGGVFSLTPLTGLTGGTHTVYATYTIAGGSSFTSAPISFDVSGSVSITVKRRRHVCPKNQDLCSYAKSDGSLAYQCIDDVWTNIERCGSCNGPDCSAIPFANDVRCEDGRCVVSSCENGYVSTGSWCIKREFQIEN